MAKNLYQMIVDDLTEEIRSGKLPVNAKVPTEQELANRYHVSRITSKRALNELVKADLIYRKQGSGSFVKSTEETHTSPTANEQASQQSIYLIIPNLEDDILNTLVLKLQSDLASELSNVFISPQDNIQNSLQKLSQSSVEPLCILIGDTISNDLIYQLYELNIPFSQLTTLINPLGFPQVVLSFQSVMPQLINLASHSVQKVVYLSASQPTIFFDQNLKIELLQTFKTGTLSATSHPTLTLANNSKTLAQADTLIVENFYDLLTYQAPHPQPTCQLIYCGFFLNQCQKTFLDAQKIPVITFDLQTTIQALQTSIMQLKKGTQATQNVTVSAQILLNK